MTDFMDNLLTSMSSKFNEQKEVGPINLNEDKTLKWRGLHNNQYAAVKKRRKISAAAAAAAASTTTTTTNTVNPVDTPENGDSSTIVDTVDSNTTSEKIIAKDEPNAIAVNVQPTDTERKSNRRILRRKLIDDTADDGSQRSNSRGNKKKAPETTAVDGSSAIEKHADESSSSADANKVAGRRSIRIRKFANSGDQIGQGEPAVIAATEQQTKAIKLKTNDGVRLDGDLIDQPRLRRSERTLHGSTMSAHDTKEMAAVEVKSESGDNTIATSSSNSNSKLRRKNTDERKSNVDSSNVVGTAATDDLIVVDDEAHDDKKDALHEQSQHGHHEMYHGVSELPADKEAITKIEDDASQPKIDDGDHGDNDVGLVDAVATAQAVRKRGRRPAGKLLPKLNVHLDQQQIATRSTRVKKSPKVNSDESAYTYSLSKKDKSLNEQAQPQQRLSRRIKPTAKILANEELRQGFELQNNARLSMSNENLAMDIDRSPRHDVHSRRTSRGDASGGASLNGSDKEEQKSSSAVVTAYFPAPAHVERMRLHKRPCPDPEKLLNEIKLGKINLHRSPEDNKKLNLKQKKRLYKLKEKHFHRLGLQKTNKSSQQQSSSDTNAESDAEDFVPAKRINNLGRPSVTLRLRGQKDIVIYDKHIRPVAKAKDKHHKEQHATVAPVVVQPQQPQKSLPPPMTSISLAALRNPEISLISSTKHKQPSQMNGGQATNKVSDRDTTAAPSIDKTVCLCVMPSKYYTKKTDNTFCTAIDQIEQQHVGCCNEIKNDLPNLLRPSVGVSYMVLCDSHRRRLLSHNCCAGCGIFCTQGKFILCQQNHFFHRDCATKFILNAVYDPSRPNYTYPTLVLKCPHCGSDAPEADSTITMRCAAAPIFMPSPKNNLRLAKMSITNSNDAYDRDHAIIVNLEKIMPDSVVEILLEAQKNAAAIAHDQRYTTKDMFYAINQNDIEMMAGIIASGFDITTPMKDFGTCLHLVASFGSLTMAYLILCRITTVSFMDRLDKALRTATMCSVVGEKNEILKLLIQCGADVTLKGPDGQTALHLAAKTGNLEAVRLLLDNYRRTASVSKLDKFINATDDGGWTPMVWASEVGNSDMVSAFLNSGANPNVCDAENNTALHWSTLSENIDTVMMLLQAGSNLSVQNMNGDTPLHIACRNQNTNIALLLLANGASLEVTNNADEAPYDCILNENGPCGKAIFFNLQIRSITGSPKYVVVNQDISNGREMYPIQIIRKTTGKNDRQAEFDFNDQIIPDFKYITKTILYQNDTHIDRRISQMRICSCLDNCTTQNCQCGDISVRNWYTTEGRLNADFNFRDPAMIFECNDVCGCNKMLCKNRIVQNGTKVPMQVFECDDKVKGLGIQALKNIPMGTFVAEYIGEILTGGEADRRTDDSYFFDLGTTDHCIDANFYGNASRFFNHSCVPNVVPIRVYYDHQDLRFPKIAFFACRDIEANEEITFDYGEKFWIVKYRTFRCHCGAPTCRYSDDTIKETLDQYNQRIAAEN